MSERDRAAASPFPDAFGPNFAVEDRDDDPAWIGVPGLGSPEVLAARVEHARTAIGGIGTSAREIRAVASTVALGLFSRLLSPFVGAAVAQVDGPVPDPGSIWLRPVDEGPIRMATTAPRVPADPEGALDALVLPLVARFADQFLLSRQVLIGDVAAAVVGACEVVVYASPDLSEAADDVRARLLTLPSLAGSGNPRGPFVRTSCCLIYQLPMHYICGNCVLVHSGSDLVRRREDDVAGSPGFRERFREQLEAAERTRTWGAQDESPPR